LNAYVGKTLQYSDITKASEGIQDPIVKQQFNEHWTRFLEGQQRQDLADAQRDRVLSNEQRRFEKEAKKELSDLRNAEVELKRVNGEAITSDYIASQITNGLDPTLGLKHLTAVKKEVLPEMKESLTILNDWKRKGLFVPGTTEKVKKENELVWGRAVRELTDAVDGGLKGEQITKKRDEILKRYEKDALDKIFDKVIPFWNSDAEKAIQAAVAGTPAPTATGPAPTPSVLNEKTVRKQLTDKNITGIEQDEWVKTYRKRGIIR
jgi:hypothetical protein